MTSPRVSFLKSAPGASSMKLQSLGGQDAARASPPSVEKDLRDLILQAQRMCLLLKCVAECPAVPGTAFVPSSRWSSSSGSLDTGSVQSCEEMSETTTSSWLSNGDGEYGATGNIVFERPPSACSDDASSCSSFYDTRWITHDGLVDPELLDRVRLGTLTVDDLVPNRPYALSAAGWRQLGDLFMAVVTSAKAKARRTKFASDDESNIAFARIAQMRMKAAKMYRIAREVDESASSDSEVASSGPPSSDDDESHGMPKLYTPVPIRARSPDEPTPVEWLTDMAEIRLEYFQLRKNASSPGGPLRARPIREELDAMEYLYRLHWIGDPNWSPTF